MTASAKEMFDLAYNGARLTNTKLIKYGKINKNMAYEIVKNNYGCYGNEHTLTIISFDTESNRFKTEYDLMESCNYTDIDTINGYVNELKEKYNNELEE